MFLCLYTLGVFPLLVFVFGRFFMDLDTNSIPYGEIVISLLYLFLPVSAGLLVRYFKPAWADKCQRGVLPFSIIFLVYVIGFGSFINPSIYRFMGRYPLTVLVGASLPVAGFGFGLLIALLLRQTWEIAITIAIETGVQNVGIAILMLLYALPQPMGDMGATMPILISIFTPLPLIPFGIYQCIKRTLCRCRKKDSLQE